MVDNIRYLVGMEALYAAQAIDLRKQKRPLPLGRVTGRAYEAFREVIPFLGEDRNMHLEIQHAYDFIASRKLMEIIGRCTESHGLEYPPNLTKKPPWAKLKRPKTLRQIGENNGK